jgi:hypothetical protein
MKQQIFALFGAVCALVLAACGAPAPKPADTPPAVTPAPVQAAKIAPSTPLAAPTGTPAPRVDAPGGQRFPDIMKVELKHREGRRFDVLVTMTSPYDTPQRYADGWRVLDPSGTTLGVHTLLHNHADEQPFTRVQSGVEIPAGVLSVTVEGRDKTYGFGGRTITVDVPAVK